MAYYLTTPIYYPNGNLHIGHTYTTIVADVMKRYQKLKGKDVFFLTGTDEHGQKILETATKAGMKPKELTDGIVESAKKLWKALDIDYDEFLRTVDENHMRVAQEVFSDLYEKGDIYKDEYEGLYCVPCEAYFTESQAEEGKFCPDCGRELTKHKEESYFFRLSKYTDELRKWLSEADIEPSYAKDEMIKNFLDKGLDDLSVTRTTCKWGIPVPFDENHVMYVWMDALLSYVSGIGYKTDESKFNKYWPCDLHLMGKEILRFHILIWPAILMALDLPLPKKVFAHGWIVFENDKMSKSKGNVFYPEPIIETLGADTLRYFILREFSFGSDGNFTIEKLVQRYNSDLVNDLGNLVSRTTAMIEKYFDGVIPAPNEIYSIDEEVRDLIEVTKDKFSKEMDELRFNFAIEEVFKLIRRANRYIDETEPWVLSKEDEDRLKTVLYILSEVIVESSRLLSPVIDNTSKEIFKKMGLSDVNNDSIEPGLRVNKGKNLYDRVDDSMVDRIRQLNEELFSKRKVEGKSLEAKSDEKPVDEIITFDDFTKVKMRVGEIVEVMDHPDADRLYVLKVDIGDEVRTVVSGLREHYKKDELMNKKVTLLCNLKPAKLRGIMSEGMVLACGDKEVKLIVPDGDVKNGSDIS